MYIYICILKFFYIPNAIIPKASLTFHISSFMRLKIVWKTSCPLIYQALLLSKYAV